ncbi:hypothetical protein BCR44DRAFT_44605, partial [Catenaria anguillulae PL171]
MDCGPINPLTQLKQQFDHDPHQFSEAFRQQPQGFRSAGPASAAAAAAQQDLAEEFFRTGGAAGASSSSSSAAAQRPLDPAFAFHDLHEQLDHLSSAAAGPAHAPAAAANWHAEFAKFQHPQHAPLNPAELAQFDAAFAHAKQAHLAGATPEAAWAQEFNQSAALHAPPAVHLSAEETAALDRAFQEATEAAPPKSWEQEFADQEQKTAEQWTQEFTGTDAEKAQLSATAGELLESMGDALNDPKFSNSEFMKFMAQLRDQELTIEGDKVVPGEGSAAPGGGWAAEFAQRADKHVESMWAEEFGKQFMGNEADWAEDFDLGAFGTGLEDGTSAAAQQGGDAQAWAQEFDRLAQQIDPSLKLWNMDLPEYAQYEFEPVNTFMSQSMDQLQALPIESMPLADAILALEATVTQDPTNARAWALLGIKQQENERERQAVSALRRALEHDPTQLDAWLALSVSYTNENHPEPAFDSLRNWVRNNPKYAHLESAIVSTGDSFRDVSAMFLEATQLDDAQAMDPDVQVGLGVLFNVSEEYDKAVDCFQAALGARPDDYLLWNKLGATLANSHDASRAMDAYFHALAINPSYIRARYNLAIACINLGQHREAAHHLIEALSIQLGDGDEDAGKVGAPRVTSGFMSANVWDTLRMACLLMNKAEWATLC